MHDVQGTKALTEAIRRFAAVQALNCKPWNDVHKDERLTFDDTLAAYTVAGAYACHRENLFGSLQVGHAADIVILDRALTTDTIAQTQVGTTICNGKITYQR